MFEDLENKNELNPDATKMSNFGLKPVEPNLSENISYEEKLDKFKNTYIPEQKTKKIKLKKVLLFFIIILIAVFAVLIFSKNIGKFKMPQLKTIEKVENTDTGTNNISTSTASSTEEKVINPEITALLEDLSIVLLDTDQDGLLDIYETNYKTDSSNSDSDGDRYIDGMEVITGYTPSGSGKLTDDDKNIYYFAYGSNMDLDTMKQRCGEGNFVGFKDSILNNYVFYFYDRGFANIRPILGNDVNGVLYKINQKCLDDLDLAEGYPNTYNREKVIIKNPFGNFESWIYIVENDNSKGSPDDSYLSTVIKGAKQYGLPIEYIQYILSLK